jgi:hypothetical protein
MHVTALIRLYFAPSPDHYFASSPVFFIIVPFNYRSHHLLNPHYPAASFPPSPSPDYNQSSHPPAPRPHTPTPPP